jgi:hypothetical protein
MEELNYSVKCRARTFVDDELPDRVDITVYSVPRASVTDIETALAQCEQRDRDKYAKLGWKLLELKVELLS